MTHFWYHTVTIQLHKYFFMLYNIFFINKILLQFSFHILNLQHQNEQNIIYTFKNTQKNTHYWQTHTLSKQTQWQYSSNNPLLKSHFKRRILTYLSVTYSKKISGAKIVFFLSFIDIRRYKLTLLVLTQKVFNYRHRDIMPL